jgi:hypothetical protein
MTISIISTPITTEITLGSGNYARNITITNAGTVETASGPAIYGDYSYSTNGYMLDPTLTNDGLIESGGGGQYAATVEFGSLSNAGTIVGVNGLSLVYSTANNSGLITTSTGAGTALSLFGGNLTNSGSINGTINLEGASLGNTGQLSGPIYGNGESAIVNQCVIRGQVTLNTSGLTNTNTGTIIGGVLDADPYSTYVTEFQLVNDGLISSAGIGVTFTGNGVITDAGTIAASTYAILSAGPLDLIIDTGAQFEGKVEDADGSGTIILGGSTSVGLSVGSQFIGFDSFSFASATSGTLEGGVAAVAAGQTITGFTIGDTIILDGFAATSEMFNDAAGLTLSNATASQTLAIEGLHYNADFTATTENGNTTLTMQNGSFASTIAGTIAHVVLMATGYYPYSLSITNTGAVTTASGPAIYGEDSFNIVGGTEYVFAPTLTNDGLIASGGSSSQSSQYAATIIDGTLSNAGTIIGVNAVNLNYATAHNSGLIASSGGGTALNMSAGNFTNSGLINGAINMLDSYLENNGQLSGTIYGQTDSDIFNQGTISGQVTISASGLTNSNTGTIIGSIQDTDSYYTYDDELQFFNEGLITSTDTGITFSGDGTITNAGTIEGSTYAILATGTLDLIIEAGAQFEGKVEDAGSGTIILGGSTAVGLSLNSQFIGFDSFSFASTIAGTLEGGIAALAAGQTISGFTNGDTIILDGFAATSETFNQATGLTLSNGTASQTLGLQGLPYNAAFSITNSAGTTTLTVQNSPVAVVSGTIAAPVTLGAGNYAASFTITSTGAALSGVTALFGAVNSTSATLLPTLVNQGLISGTGSQYAVQLDYGSGPLANSGTIVGHDGVKFDYATATNSGLIVATGSAGTAFYLRSGTLFNSGTIQGSTDLIYGNLINTGNVTGPVYEKYSYVNNQGHIIGAVDLTRGSLTNSGTLSGGINQNAIPPNFGVSNAYIANTGLITGNSIGISLASLAPNGFSAASTIINAGTIVGSTYAILAAGLLDLTVDAGAVFNGKVVDQAGTGTLILADTTAGSLDLGTSFSGFSAISIANGATWTLEGSASALASGQTISGFTNGDTIILAGFAATSETFNHATGLTLSNGTQTEILGLTGLPFDTQFTLATDGTNTTITAPVTPVSLISTAIIGQVTPGYGNNYSSDFTITNTGTVTNSGSAAVAAYRVAAGSVSATIVNAGTIAATNAFAVLLANDATLTNTGLISGGISANNAVIENEGVILSTGKAVYVEYSYLLNTGTIAGSIGVAQDYGFFVNAGTVIGSQDAVSLSGEMIVKPGAVFDGNIISSRDNGVLLLAATTTGSLDLTGTVTGFAIDFGLNSHWTLEGGQSALASGQTIGGFVAGDTIILDNFAATSESFNQTIGLILSNGSSTETLALTGAPSGANFSLSTAGGNTTIAPLFAPVSLITGTIANHLTLAGADYAASVTITPTGLLLNGLYAGYNSAGISITNLGTINSVLGYNIFLDAPDTLSNWNEIGTEISAVGATIFNNGTIAYSSPINNLLLFDRAVAAEFGGNVVNTGLITDADGHSHGVFLYKAMMTNSGTITGGTGVYARLSSFSNSGTISGESGAYAESATITNSGGIGGTYGGLYLKQTTLTNSGHIFGGEATTFSFNRAAGISVEGGLITNTGSIGGFSFGIYAYGVSGYQGVSTIINAGTISGGTDAIYALGTIDLTVDPGAVFNGNVVDQAGAGTLILAGTTSGAIDLSDPITGFSNITFAQAAHWSLAGTSAELAGGETISGFTLGDTIALTDFAPTSSTFISGTGLILSNGTTSETLNLAGNFTNAAFTVSNSAVAALCFARDTKIHTPKGKRRIETLQIGDKILTRDGTAETIKWIGRRSYDGRFIANNHLALPVTIKAHALAKNIPSRDLTVSPGHGIFISGVLIPAWRLINGVTITQAAQIEKIDYFHIELDRHSVILAENCPAESFLDIGLRQQFHNAAEYTGTPNTQATPLPRLERDSFKLSNLSA